MNGWLKWLFDEHIVNVSVVGVEHRTSGKESLSSSFRVAPAVCKSSVEHVVDVHCC